MVGTVLLRKKQGNPFLNEKKVKKVVKMKCKK